MKTHFSISIFLFVMCSCITLSAQEYLGLSKEQIIDKIKNSINTSLYTATFSDTIIHYDSTDHLGVVYTGIEKIEVDYYFSEFSDCDSIIVKYSCPECIDTHIKQFLDYKENRNWIAITTDHYISTKGKTKEVTKLKDGKSVKKVGTPQMKITRTPGNDVAATIVFYSPLMDEKEWEKLVKK